MLALAEQWAQYSTCVRRKVGAVLYHPETKAVVSIGFNDTPSHWEDCGDGGCEVCQSDDPAKHNESCNCVHSEMNAVLLAARRGAATEGCYIAVWTHDSIRPCRSCTKNLVQAGVVMVVTPKVIYSLGGGVAG